MKLIRIAYTKNETMGILFIDKLPFCLTLERPWKDNKRSISCIPKGDYICKRVASPKFGNTFKVMDVLNRSHILFHKGNIAEDTHGCILVGDQFGHLKGSPAVLSSGTTFDLFLKKLEDTDSFFLTITGEN